MIIHLAQTLPPLWNCGKASFPSCKTRDGWESGTESAPPDRMSEVTVQGGLNQTVSDTLSFARRQPLQQQGQEGAQARGRRHTQPSDGSADMWSRCYAFAHRAFKQKPGPFEGSVQRPLLFHLGPAAHGFRKSSFRGGRCVLGGQGAWYRLWLPVGAQERAVNCMC